MAVAMRRVRTVAALDAADALLLGIDVIELVNHRIELRHPRRRARIEPLLPRSIERLIAETRKRERQHVLDGARADRHPRRFRDEPFRASRDAARRTVAPEVVA